MEVFGWVLFTIGSLLLLIFGAVGLNGNVINLAGVIIGMSLMVSGAIFITSGRLESAFRRPKDTGELRPTSDDTKKEQPLVLSVEQVRKYGNTQEIKDDNLGIVVGIPIIFVIAFFVLYFALSILS